MGGGRERITGRGRGGPTGILDGGREGGGVITRKRGRILIVITIKMITIVKGGGILIRD